MPIADDWTIDYIDKKVSHTQFKDEITGSDSSVAEVSTVECDAVSGNITTGDYFNLWSATDATAYYVWYNVASGGGDPAPAGKTAIAVAVGATDTAAQVATATQTAIHATADFNAAVNTDTITVTITNANKGSATNVANGVGLAEFKYNIGIAEVVCAAGSSFTTTGAGDYFVLYSANDTIKYHVWYNVDDGSPNTDPVPLNSTGIEVLVLAADTTTQVATKTAFEINTTADFNATSASATVTITNATAGPSTDVANGVSCADFTYTTLANPVKGIGKTVWSVNALYSFLQDQFDELGNMDDKVPMDAQTPTEYRFINDWFIDEVSIKYLKGGAIKTSSWLRAVGTNTGIVQVIYSGATAPAATDIGLAIVHEVDLDAGVLLFADISTARKRLWIRPNSSASSNNFDSTSGNLDITGGTQNIVQSAASSSGENTWANMFTLGTVETNTAIYVVQDTTKVSAWWPVGQIDVLLRVLEAGSTVGANGGDIRDIFIGAREYSKLYDHFISLDITGGRNPVPLATAADLNNTTGQYTIEVASTTNFIIGDRFRDTANNAKEGTVTALMTAPIRIAYYLSGTSLTQFGSSGTIERVLNSAHTTTISAAPADLVADYGTTTPVILTFSSNGSPYSRNLNNGNGAVNYNCEINLGGRTVSQMYEWLKFITRRGAVATPQLKTGTGTITNPSFANINGEQYIKLLAGTLAVDDFTPVKASPFGTFAGGKFFGAQGVWITNYAAADAQNFQLIDSNGATQVPPNTVSVTVTNLRQSDVIGVFVLTGTGGTINKAKYTFSAGQAAGLTTITVASIDTETPQAGVIRVVDVSDPIKAEQQYRYRSWDSGTNAFTLNLFPTSATVDVTGGAGDSTTLTDTSLTTTNFVSSHIRPGDIVRNTTDGSVATVVSVNSGTEITTTGLTGGTDNTFTNTDNYTITTETNRAYTTSDTAYAPVLNATGVYYSPSATNFGSGTGADNNNPASMTNTLIKKTVAQGGSDIPVLVRIRRATVGVSDKIIPFEIAQTIGQSGMSQAAIRTLDSIIV